MFASDGYDPTTDPGDQGPTTVPSPSWEQARAPRRADLEGQILEKLANVNAAQAQLLELIDSHDRDDYWGDWAGINSEAQWLSFRAGLPLGAGRSYLRLARALRELPRLKASFAAGRLTLQQVAAVADIATPDTDEDLTELAEGLTGAQLSSFCRYYRDALHANDDPSPKRRLHFHYNNRGMGRLTTTMPTERLGIIEKALLALEDQVTLDDDADDPYAARRADALVAAAQAALAGQPKETDERYQVVIHADAEALTGPPGRREDDDRDGNDGEALRDEHAPRRVDDGGDDELRRTAYVDGAGAIGDIALEQILCQCAIVPLLQRHGQPLDIGRASRTPTRAIRRALKARDRHCRFPGCSNDAYTEAHHLTHWANLGDTKIEELVLLCWTHHRMVHRRHIRIEMSADGPIFMGSSGRVITVPPRVPATKTLDDEDIDSETCLPAWGGEPGNMRRVADRYLADRYLGYLDVPERV